MRCPHCNAKNADNSIYCCACDAWILAPVNREKTPPPRRNVWYWLRSKKRLLTPIGVVTALCILLLCLLPHLHARRPQDAPTTSQTQYADHYEFVNFYWHSIFGTASSFTQESIAEDGSAKTSTYSFDGVKYTVTDSNGIRTYSHLILDEVREKNGSGYLQMFYMLLSDDPTMTYQRYQDAKKQRGSTILPTELCYIHTMEMDSAETFGTAPGHMKTLLSAISTGIKTYYGKDSFFVVECADSLTVTDSIIPVSQVYIARYAYDGSLLCTAEAQDLTQSLTELADGGFATVTIGDHVLCYNANGTLRWQYSLSADYIPYIFQANNHLYCMGTIHKEDACDDLYFCKLSMDGTLIVEKTVGGSDFERLTHARAAEDGFILCGITQSRDGDLPFSNDGYGVDFRAQLSLNLEFTDASPLPNGDYYLTQVGFYNTAIYDNDPILKSGNGNRLPSDTHVEGLYACENGYVILRVYSLNDYPFSPPAMSYRMRYRQLLATGYDTEGKPIWQTVSEPFVQ